MPPIGEVPSGLKPYIFHGVNVTPRPGQEEAIGSCPFCGREGKWYCNQETALWDCKVCAKGGNAYTFIRELWQECERTGDVGPYETLEELAAERKLLSAETLEAWGVRRSVLTGEWLVPGFGADGEVNNLYRYARAPSGKRTLMGTPEMHHQLFGVPLLGHGDEEIWITEGPWDGMALWEVLRRAKDGKTGEAACVPAEEHDVPLLGRCGVLAVPGTSVFYDGWAELCAGKKVVLVYDSDHPKLHCRPCKKTHSKILHVRCPDCAGELSGPEVPPAGHEGLKRAAAVLANSGRPPISLRYLCWGKDGYDATAPSGHDLRDYLAADPDPVERVEKLNRMLLDDWLAPVPEGWASAVPVKDDPRAEMECAPCHDWAMLQNAWRKALKWTDGLDRALSVMLACITSTKAVGSQLWVKIMSPPSTGKSTLCEALSVNRKYVYPKDSMTGLLSGYQADKEGEENQSLAERLRDKTLVIKDGDTILNEPNLGKVLGQFRAFYDRNIRSQYGNKMSTDHEGINATVILCGTSSLHRLDSSELGDRFLSCFIMDGVDEELEDEILTRVAHRAERNMNYEANGKMETQHEPELVDAMRLTGGYVSYLRANATALLGAVVMPKDALTRCIILGKFVAYVRARQSTKQDEKAEREFAARLVEQMVRLAKCLAVVLNKSKVDNEVMERVTRVALDTGRGRTLELAKVLRRSGRLGNVTAPLCTLLNQSEKDGGALLRFLRKIGVVELYLQQTVEAVRGRPLWRLTERFEAIYDEVIGLAATAGIV